MWYQRLSKKRMPVIMLMSLLLVTTSAFCEPFDGFDSPSLSAVSESPGQWGLRIVVFDVGQADAIMLLTPNGDVCLIDSGKTNGNGDKIVEYMTKKDQNGVGSLNVIDLLYSTHYDQDHIGGIDQIVKRNMQIRKAFDQGLSHKRKGKDRYVEYVTSIGDPNDNLIQDLSESEFVRHRLDVGHIERIGLEDQLEIQCVSVRGDTVGDDHDLHLDPSSDDIDENPGSIALIVRLGDFEFYTAGDQTDDDFKSEPAVEEALMASHAIPGGNDIDVLKVSHHGSDTSTSVDFVQAIDPEVAIISSKLTKDGLPKRITIKTLQDNRCFVLITGDGLKESGEFTNSSGTDSDDHFIVDSSAVHNKQGDVSILVSPDGKRYTVTGSSFSKTFSANDGDNVR